MNVGPYEGIRVLELGEDSTVAFAGLLLADRGAEVIKVESLDGNALRRQSPHRIGESKTFQWLCRGKRSLALDVDTPDGREIVRALALQVDVLISSWPTAHLTALGLDAAALGAQHPALLYVHSSHFGPLGPDAGHAANQLVMQAYSGMMAGEGKTREDGVTPRAICSTEISALPTGVMMSLAVSTGLLHRQRSGRGQQVEVSELAAAVNVQGGRCVDNPAADTVRMVVKEKMRGLRTRGASFTELRAAHAEQALPPGNVFYRGFRTRDGAIFIGALTKGLREKVRKSIGTEFLFRDDPAYDLENPDFRAKLIEHEQATERLLRSGTTAEWLKTFEANGVPCGEVVFPEDLADNAQARANGYVIEVEHPLDGPQLQVASPAQFSRWPEVAYAPSPALGQHTEEYVRALGYDAARIATLRAQRVLS